MVRPGRILIIYFYTPPPNNQKKYTKTTQHHPTKMHGLSTPKFSFTNPPFQPGFPTGTSHSGEGWYGRASCHGGVWSMVPLAKTGKCWEIDQKTRASQKNSMPNTPIKHQQKHNTDLKYRSFFSRRGWRLLMHGFGVLDLGKNIFPQCPKTVTVMNLLCPIQGNGLQQFFSFFQVMKCYPTGDTSFTSTPEIGKFPRLILPSTKTYVSAGDFANLKLQFDMQLCKNSMKSTNSLYMCLRQDKSQHFQWDPGTKCESKGKKRTIEIHPRVCHFNF